MGLRLQFAFAFVAAAVGFRVPRRSAKQNVSSNLTSTASCQSWCESDHSGGNNQGRHCAPGDMAHLCGSCSFCQGQGACESWCEADYSGGNNQGRHCAPGDMAGLCGGCSFCGGSSPSPSPSPTPSGGGSFNIRVVSYNLFWWNAFRDNPWKGDSIVANIKNTLRADTLGLQECDEPGTIQSRTGYIAASAFAGAQGVSVKSGLFNVGQTGSRDIQATGHWGPRHVTWAELTHKATGRTFWHFNTHWCTASCDANKRYRGAVNMVNIIREKAGSMPVVITGDFNAHEGMGEPGIRHFLNNGFTKAVDHWVDAVFYTTAHWNRISYSVGNAAGSDHKPVIADLQLK